MRSPPPGLDSTESPSEMRSQAGTLSSHDSDEFRVRMNARHITQPETPDTLFAGIKIQPSVFCGVLRCRTVVIAVGCLFGIWFSETTVAAEKPQIDFVFPAGGMRGTTVSIRPGGKPGDGPLQVWSDTDLLAVTVSEKGDTASVRIADNLLPGIYHLRFFNTHGASSLKPFVVGRLPESEEKEPNNRLSEANAVPESGGVANGILQEAGDVDTYAILLRKGQTVVGSMLAHRELNSPMDATLQLLNPRGTLMEQNDDDHGNDPQLVHEAREDGIHYLRTFAFPSEPNSTIQFSGAASYVYRLTVSTGPFADHAMPMAIQRQSESRVALSGWNISETSRSPLISADSTTGALVRVDPELTLPVFLDVVDHRSFVEPAGDISATVNGSASLQTDLAVPFSMSGVIRRRMEKDRFRVTGRKDQRVRIRVIARTRFSQLDPMISVTAEDDREILTADDIDGANMDVQTELTFPSDGVFHFIVTDRFEHGSERHFYRLTVEEPRPDFSVTAADNAFIKSADQPISIPITIDRKDGFLAPIDFRLEGLPEGLVSEPTRSEKDGDSAKAVTLKISGATAQGFHGPVRIVAVPVSGSVAPRPVTSAVPGTLIGTDRIWLTVPGTP